MSLENVLAEIAFAPGEQMVAVFGDDPAAADCGENVLDRAAGCPAPALLAEIGVCSAPLSAQAGCPQVVFGKSTSEQPHTAGAEAAAQQHQSHDGCGPSVLTSSSSRRYAPYPSASAAKSRGRAGPQQGAATQAEQKPTDMAAEMEEDLEGSGAQPGSGAENQNPGQPNPTSYIDHTASPHQQFHPNT